MMAGEGVEESGGRLDYRGKMILAPMVKVILSDLLTVICMFNWVR